MENHVVLYSYVDNIAGFVFDLYDKRETDFFTSSFTSLSFDMFNENKKHNRKNVVMVVKLEEFKSYMSGIKGSIPNEEYSIIHNVLYGDRQTCSCGARTNLFILTYRSGDGDNVSKHRSCVICDSLSNKDFYKRRDFAFIKELFSN